MSLLILIFLGLLPFAFLTPTIVNSVKEKVSVRQFFVMHKYKIIIAIIILIGTLIRLVKIDIFPGALNVDEASSAYDAYTILHFGIDKSGRSFPIYLYAWGVGQSVLYSYLSIPFIAIMGLTEYSCRIVMAIFGVLAIYAFYGIIDSVFNNKKLSIIGLTLFAICPWHIMMSRWGMECNIFPDIVLIATYFLIKGIKGNKRSFIIAFIILAISSYSYSTSYIFLPVYVLGCLFYLWYKKELELKKCIKYFLIVFVICIPIMLYAMVNVLDLSEFKFLGLTITKLAHNRYEDASIIFQDNIFEKCVDNLLDTLKLLIIQNDGLEWNALPDYGLFYPISSIFLFIGVYYSHKKYKDNLLNQIMNIWMYAAIVISAFCIVNINRVNIIMIPCVYYIAIGIFEFTEKYKITFPILTIIYLFSFVAFTIDYSHQDYNDYYTFTSGIKEVCEYCSEINDINDKKHQIYCEYSFKEPYIYFLFYQKEDPNNYIDSVKYFDENGIFDNVKEYSNYHFYLPEEVKEGDIIIIQKGSELTYNINYKKSTYINQFIVYEY